MNEVAVVRSYMERYERFLASLLTKLEGSPTIPGRLQIVRHGNQVFHYCRERQGEALKRKERYLSASRDGDLIRRLGQQDYDRRLHRAAVSQLHDVQLAMDQFPAEGLEHVYTDLHPCRKDLVSPLVPDGERFLREWQEACWPLKGFDRNAPEIYSNRGERVRSKSEKIIADYYLYIGQPYRYECPLRLKDGSQTIILHPDFTLLDRWNLKTIYHEHFGKMDDPEYVEKFIRRLRIYTANGIFPGDKLLMTFETRNSPFDTSQLEPLLRKYLPFSPCDI